MNAQIQLLVLTLDTLFIHVQMVENNTFHEVLQKNMKSTKVQTLGVMAAVYIHALMHRSGHAHAHFQQR